VSTTQQRGDRSVFLCGNLMGRGHMKVLGITEEVKERKARRWGLGEGPVAGIWA